MQNKSFMLGASENCTYTFSKDPAVKDKHLLVTPVSDNEYLIRQIADNGVTIVNKKKIVCSRIDKYTKIKIGRLNFTINDLLKSNSQISKGLKSNQESSKKYHIGYNGIYIIGASDSADVITIPSSRLAWNAFRLTGNKGNWVIQQIHGSRKKFRWENDKPLNIASYQIKINGSDLIVEPITNSSVDLSNIDVIVKDKGKKKILARSLDLSVRSGEFVGIIGPSGAGKSVLLKTIRGIMRPKSGKVLINAKDALGDHSLLQKIGFIPQDDVVYQALTVEENIRFATKLRIPSDWPKEAIEKKIQRIIEQMSLNDCRYTLVKDISGGQRKRVNLATEMVTEPPIILADEVCSGLSSWDTANIIRHLRRISDVGKIVMLTIHTPDIDTLEEMDMLLVYDRGGYIAYYGPAHPDAMQYFSRRNISPYRSPKLIFDVLEKQVEGKKERKTLPEKWAQIYRNSSYHKTYIKNRIEFSLASVNDEQDNCLLDAKIHHSIWKQILLLTQRRLLTFYRDKTDVFVTFGQAPLMAFAFFFAFINTRIVNDAKTFFPYFRFYDKIDIIIFLAVLAVVWFGSSKSIAELPRSWVYFRQEHLSFLNSTAFVISRFIALSIIVLGQIVAFAITFHTLFIVIPNDNSTPCVSFFSNFMFPLLIKAILLMWLISIAAIATAMFISFFIRSTSAANAILPFLLILQILLGGSRLAPLITMYEKVYITSQAMVSRWGFEAIALLYEFNLPYVYVKGTDTDSKSIMKKLKITSKYDFKINQKLFEELKKNDKILTKQGVYVSESDLWGWASCPKEKIVDGTALWDEMITTNPKAKLFRPSNMFTVLLVLFLMTFVLITTLSLLFKIRYRR